MSSRVGRNREEKIQAYAQWLRGFRWAWFGTLKFVSGRPSERRARRIFARWIADLQLQDGGPDFRWVAVLEKSTSGANIHFHVLVGGLRNRTWFWGNEWEQRGGEALIEPYDATRQGLLYMLKGMDEGGDIDIDFNLPKSANPSAVDGAERKRRG